MSTHPLHGAILIHKPEGISSFGVIEELQRQLGRKLGVKRRDLPKLGHGGTLDPFATGLLVVCVGNGTKLSRYFLGSKKTYEARMRFGETSISGDHTDPISEKSDKIPTTLLEIQKAADAFMETPYLQIPPMHSAKKRDGKPLYELARQGIEVERAPSPCTIHRLEVLSYAPPHAFFRVECSAGTYIRTLAQDLAKDLGSLALLETLHRVASGSFHVDRAWTVEQVADATLESPKSWSELPCWIPFDQMMNGYTAIEVDSEEALAILHGKQAILTRIFSRCSFPLPEGVPLPLTLEGRLVAVCSKKDGTFGLDRVFPLN